jgi:hypothetical protein
MLNDLASIVSPAIPGMFGDPRCERIGQYQYKILIDNIKVGVVVASMKPNFFSYALNQGDTEEVREAKQNGKRDVGFVVLAKINNYGHPVYVDHFNIDDVDAKVAGCDLIQGRYGAFWSLPASTAANYNADEKWM